MPHAGPQEPQDTRPAGGRPWRVAPASAPGSPTRHPRTPRIRPRRGAGLGEYPPPPPRSWAPASAAAWHPQESPPGQGLELEALARRPERVPAAALLHLAGHREPDQRVHHVLAVVPAGERLDDGSLGARHAIREQLEDGGRDVLDHGVELGGASVGSEGFGARHAGPVAGSSPSVTIPSRKRPNVHNPEATCPNLARLQVVASAPPAAAPNAR